MGKESKIYAIEKKMATKKSDGGPSNYFLQQWLVRADEISIQTEGILLIRGTHEVVAVIKGDDFIIYELQDVNNKSG